MDQQQQTKQEMSAKAASLYLTKVMVAAFALFSLFMIFVSCVTGTGQ